MCDVRSQPKPGGVRWTARFVQVSLTSCSFSERLFLIQMGDEKDSWKVKTLDEILQEKKRRKEQEEKAEIKRMKNVSCPLTYNLFQRNLGNFSAKMFVFWPEWGFLPSHWFSSVLLRVLCVISRSKMWQKYGALLRSRWPCAIYCALVRSCQLEKVKKLMQLTGSCSSNKNLSKILKKNGFK